MKNLKKITALFLSLSLALSVVGCTADSDATYPSGDIEVIIPFAAGGGTDISGRAFLTELNKEFEDINIVVSNVAGSSGTVGATQLYNSSNDGYTLLTAGVALNVANATGVFDYTYEDYEPIAQYCTSYLGFFVRADLGVSTYEEFVELALQEDESVIIGASVGTLLHYATLAMYEHSGAKFKTVAIGGDQVAAPELLSGRVDGYVYAISTSQAYVDSGDFICLGVFAPERVDSLPDSPTFAELGLDANFEQSFGLWAPKDTPDDVIETISSAVETVCASQEYIDTMAGLSYTASYLDTDDYRELLSGSLENINSLSYLLEE